MTHPAKTTIEIPAAFDLRYRCDACATQLMGLARQMCLPRRVPTSGRTRISRILSNQPFSVSSIMLSMVVGTIMLRWIFVITPTVFFNSLWIKGSPFFHSAGRSYFTRCASAVVMRISVPAAMYCRFLKRQRTLWWPLTLIALALQRAPTYLTRLPSAWVELRQFLFSFALSASTDYDCFSHAGSPLTRMCLVRPVHCSNNDSGRLYFNTCRA
jgi:hypothetical protein